MALSRTVRFFPLWISLLLLAVIFILHRRSGREMPWAEEPELLLSTGTIRPGGSLYQSLLAERLSGADVGGIVNSFQKRFNLKNSRPGDLYEIFRTTAGGFVKLHYWSGPADYYVVEKTSAGFANEKATLPLKPEEAAASGTIQNTLWQAMADQGLEADLIYRFAEIFSWQVDFLTEPRAGDTFRMLWERKKGDGIVLNGDILAASYEGQESGSVTAIRFKGNYYLPGGESTQQEFLRAPLRFRRISSFFRNRRYHPILRIYRPHHGIDYSAAAGTPVSAIGDGVVIFRGWKGGNGKLIKIRHRNSAYVSAYGHLSAYARNSAVGSRVSQGQVIGYVGSTGLSTGPHLHFGMEKDGRFVNFLNLKFPPARRISGKQELEEFGRVSRDLLRRLEAAAASGSQGYLTKK